MALFGSLEGNIANPPTTWQVVKVADRVWHLLPIEHEPGDAPLDSFPTKKAAENARESGHLVDLWAKEIAWMEGAEVPGWKPYSEVVAEQERIAARWKGAA